MDSIVVFLIGQVITGAAIWGAIRADIKNMHFRIDDIKRDTDEQAKRIDRLFERSDVNRRHV